MPNGMVKLTHMGVIAARGADAAKFLHGQLTNDFSLLGSDTARLAGYCSPKGRLLASFVGWKQEADTVLLACSADLLPATLKRLSMFVMRAQCKLSDATDGHSLWGAAGELASAWAMQAQLGTDTWAKADLPASALGLQGLDAAAKATLVRLPNAVDASGNPVTRLLACVASSEAPSIHGDSPVMTLADWQWLEVRSGVAMLTQPLADALVPQMLNYESVGGINFKKGCYPGQEVVARSQFRGTLKRRTYLVASPQAIRVGDDLFHSSDAEQPCGLVVAAAPHPSGEGFEALAALQTVATLSGSIRTQNAGGTDITLLPLPYALLEDI